VAVERGRGSWPDASTSNRSPKRRSVGVRWVPVPPEVITVAVRGYLRYGLSYRDVEEPPAAGRPAAPRRAVLRGPAQRSQAAGQKVQLRPGVQSLGTQQGSSGG